MPADDPMPDARPEAEDGELSEEGELPEHDTGPGPMEEDKVGCCGAAAPGCPHHRPRAGTRRCCRQGAANTGLAPSPRLQADGQAAPSPHVAAEEPAKPAQPPQAHPQPVRLSRGSPPPPTSAGATPASGARFRDHRDRERDPSSGGRFDRDRPWQGEPAGLARLPSGGRYDTPPTGGARGGGGGLASLGSGGFPTFRERQAMLPPPRGRPDFDPPPQRPELER